MTDWHLILAIFLLLMLSLWIFFEKHRRSQAEDAELKLATAQLAELGERTNALMAQVEQTETALAQLSASWFVEQCELINKEQRENNRDLAARKTAMLLQQIFPELASACQLLAEHHMKAAQTQKSTHEARKSLLLAFQYVLLGLCSNYGNTQAMQQWVARLQQLSKSSNRLEIPLPGIPAFVQLLLA